MIKIEVFAVFVRGVLPVRWLSSQIKHLNVSKNLSHAINGLNIGKTCSARVL